MPLTGAELAAAGAVLAAGSLLQGSIGFGVALVAAPFLALIDPFLVPGPLLVGCLFLTALMSYRERASVDLRGLGWALAGRVGGTIAAAGAVAIMPRELASIVFGALVLLGVVVSAAGVTLAVNATSMLGAGALSGFMGTMTAIGGPPMALLLQGESGARLRGMLSGFFVFGTVISIASLAVVGRFGLPELRAGLALLPGIAMGFAISGRCARAIDRGFVRPGVLAVSAAAAVFVIVQATGG